MVIHQAIGIDLYLSEPGDVGRQVEKALPPFVFQEDVAAGLATVHDVIECPGIFDPKRSGYADRLFYRKSPVNS